MMKVVVVFGLFASAAAGRGNAVGSMEVGASGETNNKATIGLHGEGQTGSGLRLRMRELEAENAMLKRRYAESQLEVAELKDEMKEHNSLLQDPEQEADDVLLEEEEDGEQEAGPTPKAIKDAAAVTKAKAAVDAIDWSKEKDPAGKLKGLIKAAKRLMNWGKPENNRAKELFTIEDTNVGKFCTDMKAAVAKAKVGDTCANLIKGYVDAYASFIKIKDANKELAEQGHPAVKKAMVGVVQKLKEYAENAYGIKPNALKVAVQNAVKKTPGDKVACKAAVTASNVPMKADLLKLLT